MKTLPILLNEIANCSLCAKHLPHGVNPVVTVHPESKIAVIGQAPGSKVHASGIPWDDASGKRLRNWLNVSDQQFYNSQNFAIIPMGFCYPGKGKSGDLPPRKECAPQWYAPLFKHLPKIKLTLLIGSYAQKYYLGKQMKKNLTETVLHFEEYIDNGFFPMVHPSPLNARWLGKNKWFEQDVIPVLKQKVAGILRS